MKKLMIAAAIVCAAVYAQAGCYVWGLASGEDLTHEGGENYLTDVPFTVMLFTGTIGQTDNGDGTYSLDFSKANWVTQTSEPTGYKIGSFDFSASQTSDLVDGTAQQFSILVLDTGANISDYENYEGTYSIVSDTGVLMQDKESSIDYTSFQIGTAVTDYRTAAAVPEPTSGLLLLLGVAGLALRRRRA